MVCTSQLNSESLALVRRKGVVKPAPAHLNLRHLETDPQTSSGYATGFMMRNRSRKTDMGTLSPQSIKSAVEMVQAEKLAK